MYICTYKMKERAKLLQFIQSQGPDMVYKHDWHTISICMYVCIYTCTVSPCCNKEMFICRCCS